MNDSVKRRSGPTSIRVVSTGAGVWCWGRSLVSCPVVVVCGVLPELAEWLAVHIKVTGGQHHSWGQTNTWANTSCWQSAENSHTSDITHQHIGLYMHYITLVYTTNYSIPNYIHDSAHRGVHSTITTNKAELPPPFVLDLLWVSAIKGSFSSLCLQYCP